MSISVLIIPYIGFDYIRQTETYLRSTLESTLTNVSYVVASTLNNKPRLFSTSFSEEKNILYIHELNNVIQIDGYTTDWESYVDWSEIYQSISLANKDNFKLIISKDNDYYYVLLQVEDNELNAEVSVLCEDGMKRKYSKSMYGIIKDKIKDCSSIKYDFKDEESKEKLIKVFGISSYDL